MKLVLAMILLSYADLGFGVFASEAPGQRCVAMSSSSQDTLLARSGGNVLIAGPTGLASSTAGNMPVFPLPGEDCPYTISRTRKYDNPGAPLHGAYCVEMLPDGQRDRARYNTDIQYRVCKFLRHEISKTTRLTIWPDGFVNVKDMFDHDAMKRRTDPTDLSSPFRISYMNTQLDDGRVRFKRVYVASKM